MTFLKVFVLFSAFSMILSACSGGTETQKNKEFSQQGSAQEPAEEDCLEGNCLTESILQELASLTDLESDIAYGERLSGVVAEIRSYSPKNFQIVATCLTASRVYRPQRRTLMRSTTL